MTKLEKSFRQPQKGCRKGFCKALWRRTGREGLLSSHLEASIVPISVIVRKNDDSPDNPPVNAEQNAGDETVDVSDENVEETVDVSDKNVEVSSRKNGRPKGCTSEQICVKKRNVQKAKEEVFKMLVTLKDDTEEEKKKRIRKGIVNEKVK